MTYICIRNRGEIDPMAFHLLGASVKDHQQSIGFFGSGNKHALAVLLRERIPFRVFSGEQEVRITYQRTTFRGDSFEQIFINDQPTSLTTRMGPSWTVKHALREFWSNALDEGEEGWTFSRNVCGTPGQTRIFIQATTTVADFFAKLDSYFLPRSTVPLFHNYSGAILEPQPCRLYRRNVWAEESTSDNLQNLFSYNLDALELPETRLTNLMAARSPIGLLLGNAESVEVAKRLLEAASSNCFEYVALNYTFFWRSPSVDPLVTSLHTEFVSAGYKYIVRESQKRYVLQSALAAGEVLICSDEAATFLSNMGFPDYIKQFDIETEFTRQPLLMQEQEMLDDALASLAAIGIGFSYTCSGAIFRDASIIALAYRRECLLSKAAFESKHRLLKALVEEWTHLEHNVVDGSVGQQHVYLNLIVELIARIAK